MAHTRLEQIHMNIPSTRHDYVLWLRPLLEAALASYGFTLAKILDDTTNNRYYSWYCRDVAMGQQYIQCEHLGTQPYFWSNTSFYMECPIVNDIYHKFEFESSLLEIQVFYLGLSALTDVSYCTKEILSQNLAQRHINDIIDHIIKAIFDKTTDIQGLDDFVNGWFSKQQSNGAPTTPAPTPPVVTANRFRGMPFYYPQHLIVARLANNQHYDKLKAFFEADPSFKHQASRHQYTTTWLREGGVKVIRSIIPPKWPKLVQYLYEDIDPNSFWQQYAALKHEESRLEIQRIQALKAQFYPNSEEQHIPLSDQWYDPKNNLIWQHCCMGQHWQQGRAIGLATLFNEHEMLTLLEQFKDTDWRLPTYNELVLHSFEYAKQVGYMTKNGYDFYQKIKTSFQCHWITPMCFSFGGKFSELHIISTHHGKHTDSQIKGYTDRGYVRLVKSVV